MNLALAWVAQSHREYQQHLSHSLWSGRHTNKSKIVNLKKFSPAYVSWFLLIPLFQCTLLKVIKFTLQWALSDKKDKTLKSAGCGHEHKDICADCKVKLSPCHLIIWVSKRATSIKSRISWLKLIQLNCLSYFKVVFLAIGLVEKKVIILILMPVGRSVVPTEID